MNGYEKAGTRRGSNWKTSSRVRFAEDRLASAVGETKNLFVERRIIGTWGWMGVGGGANLAWRFARIAHALCAAPSRFRFPFISPHSTSCLPFPSFLPLMPHYIMLIASSLPFPSLCFIHPLLCFRLFSCLKVLLAALPSSLPSLMHAGLGLEMVTNLRWIDFVFFLQRRREEMAACNQGNMASQGEEV